MQTQTLVQERSTAPQAAMAPTPTPLRRLPALPKQLIVLLLIALVIRLPIAPFRGFFTDVWAYLFWGFTFIHTSTGNYYQVSGANYPPLTPDLFMLVARLYTALSQHWSAIFPMMQQLTMRVDPTVAHPYSSLALLAKVPIILGDLVGIWAIYDMARRVLPERRALLAAAIFAFSPVVLYDGVFWGQTDGLAMTFILLALRFLLLEQGLGVGVMLGLAVMTKPQPLIFLPLFLLYCVRWQGVWTALQAVGSLVATIFVVCAPFLFVHPGLQGFLQNEDTVIYHSTSSIFAFNLWYIVAPLHRYDTPILGTLTPNTIGYLLLGVAMLIVLIGICLNRSPGTLMLGTSIVAVAFFAFTTLQHERYMFPAVVTLLMATIYRPANEWAHMVANITVLFNIVVVSSRAYIGPSMNAVRNIYTVVMAHPALPMAVSYLNILLVILMLTQFVAQLVRDRVPQRLPAATLVGAYHA